MLFNNYVWNGAHVVGEHLLSNPSICHGKSVVELGAGAGLPSLVTKFLGAEPVVITDYPDDSILAAIRQNVEMNFTCGEAPVQVAAHPSRDGRGADASTGVLAAMTPAAGAGPIAGSDGTPTPAFKLKPQ